MLVKRVKPDFKKLGPRYGKIMKRLAAQIQAMESREIQELEREGTFTLVVDGARGGYRVGRRGDLLGRCAGMAGR